MKSLFIHILFKNDPYDNSICLQSTELYNLEKNLYQNNAWKWLRNHYTRYCLNMAKKFQRILFLWDIDAISASRWILYPAFSSGLFK